MGLDLNKDKRSLLEKKDIQAEELKKKKKDSQNYCGLYG